MISGSLAWHLSLSLYLYVCCLFLSIKGIIYDQKFCSSARKTFKHIGYFLILIIVDGRRQICVYVYMCICVYMCTWTQGKRVSREHFEKLNEVIFVPWAVCIEIVGGRGVLSSWRGVWTDLEGSANWWPRRPPPFITLISSCRFFNKQIRSSDGRFRALSHLSKQSMIILLGLW